MKMNEKILDILDDIESQNGQVSEGLSTLELNSAGLANNLEALQKMSKTLSGHISTAFKNIESPVETFVDQYTSELEQIDLDAPATKEDIEDWDDAAYDLWEDLVEVLDYFTDMSDMLKELNEKIDEANQEFGQKSEWRYAPRDFEKTVNKLHESISDMKSIL